MKIFLMILVLATMGEGRGGRGKGKGKEPAPAPLDNFEANEGKSSDGTMFLTLDFTIVNVETCAALCNEMERCSGFTYRVEAETGGKHGDTEAGQCRFKENIEVTTNDPNRITYVKTSEAPAPAEEEEEEEPM